MMMCNYFGFSIPCAAGAVLWTGLKLNYFCLERSEISPCGPNGSHCNPNIAADAKVLAGIMNNFIILLDWVPEFERDDCLLCVIQSSFSPQGWRSENNLLKNGCISLNAIGAMLWTKYLIYIFEKIYHLGFINFLARITGKEIAFVFLFIVEKLLNKGFCFKNH